MQDSSTKRVTICRSIPILMCPNVHFSYQTRWISETLTITPNCPHGDFESFRSTSASRPCYGQMARDQFCFTMSPFRESRRLGGLEEPSDNAFGCIAIIEARHSESDAPRSPAWHIDRAGHSAVHSPYVSRHRLVQHHNAPRTSQWRRAVQADE